MKTNYQGEPGAGAYAKKLWKQSGGGPWLRLERKGGHQWLLRKWVEGDAVLGNVWEGRRESGRTLRVFI